VLERDLTAPLALRICALPGPRVAEAGDWRYAWKMCLICIELDKNAMTFREGRRALGEMRGGLDGKHVEEVEARLDEAERDAREKPVTP
jgi:hypothetical protein